MNAGYALLSKADTNNTSLLENGFILYENPDNSRTHYAIMSKNTDDIVGIVGYLSSNALEIVSGATIRLLYGRWCYSNADRTTVTDSGDINLSDRVDNSFPGLYYHYDTWRNFSQTSSIVNIPLYNNLTECLEALYPLATGNKQSIPVRYTPSGGSTLETSFEITVL